MRAITRQHLRVLNNEDYSPVEFLDIVFPGGDPSTAVHITNAGEPITWNGNDYVPVNMSHGDVTEILVSDSTTIPSVQMIITNVNLAMAGLLNQHEIEGSQITLWMTDRRLLDRPRDAIIVTRGEARDVNISEQTATFNILNVVGITEKLTVPRRMFQPDCNYTFGSRACGVDVTISPITINTTSQAGTTMYYLVVTSTVLGLAGTVDPTDFWANGYVLFKSGPATLQSVPIAYVAGNRMYFSRPMLLDPGVGNNVMIRRACNKTKGDCASYQGNADQFGGFEGVPYGRIVPVTVDKF